MSSHFEEQRWQLMAKLIVSPKQCTRSPHPSWDLLPNQIRAFSQCLLKVMGPHSHLAYSGARTGNGSPWSSGLQALLGGELET